MSTNADNLELWNEAALNWVNFVRNQKDSYRLFLNTPATFGLLGDVLWKRVLDLGCGEGFHARLMAKKGAKVVGVEPSDLYEYAVANEQKNNLGIYYVRGRAELLETLGLGTFDVVAAFMVLHEIQDLDAAIRGVTAILKPGGSLVFSILHPMSNCSGTAWTWNGAPKPNDARQDYFKSRLIRVTWAMDGLEKPFETLHYHRPLTEYFDALARHHFAVVRILEPYPTEEQLKRFPPLSAQRQYPNFLHVKAEFKGL
jgi:SAM-dependent methyltransferase